MKHGVADTRYGATVKRGMMIFATLLLWTLGLSGCSNRQTFAASQLLSNRATEVVVYQYRDGSVAEQELTDEQVAQWTSWLGGLEIWEKTFEAGKSPADKTAMTFYEFVLNQDEEAIDYIQDGRTCYLLFDDRWYVVSNPSDPSAIWGGKG